MKKLKIKTITEKKFFSIISKHHSTAFVDPIMTISDGNMLRRERYILFKTVRNLTPKTILEIGTSFGYTTLGLALNNPTAKVYTIDISKGMNLDIPGIQKVEVLPKKLIGIRFKNKKLNITQIIGDSRKPETYRPLNSKISLFFIDGNHSFEAVVRDTLNILIFSKRGSIIFWHDFKDIFNSEVKLALCYIAAKKQLGIFRIFNTSLAAAIL